MPALPAPAPNTQPNIISVRRLTKVFGDQAALYFIRARASSLLGFTGAVLDDLARAVYFSRQAPFYLQAVTQLSFVEDVRPALVRACQEALEREPSQDDAGV